MRGAAFTWDFGDGATATGPTVAPRLRRARHPHGDGCAPTLPGASDGCGTIETRRIVTVNAPPAPVIDAPDRIAAGALVLFDAGASADPDGAVTRLRLGLRRRRDRDRRAGAAPLRRRPGSYRVRLAVTDDAGVGNSRVEAVRAVEVSAAARRRPDRAAAALPGRAARLDAWPGTPPT